MVKKADLPPCPVALTVGLIGSKWKLLLLRELMREPCYFGELLRAMDGISKKVLTESLRSMERDGIISRTVFETNPPTVQYALTPLGESLRPLFAAMTAWGETYRAAAQ